MPITETQADKDSVELSKAKELIRDLLGFVNVGDVRHHWQKKGESAPLTKLVNEATIFVR